MLAFLSLFLKFYLALNSYHIFYFCFVYDMNSSHAAS